MNYSKKDIAIGFIIIATIILLSYLYKNNKTPQEVSVSSPVPISFKKELEESFKFKIPENSSSIELKDISGGDSRGIATENEILVDAEDPAAGYFYEAWIEKDNKLISLGKLLPAKGGWLLDNKTIEKDSNSKVIISLEKVFDNKIEKKILEGSFN